MLANQSSLKIKDDQKENHDEDSNLCLFQTHLNISPSNQRLLHRGKTLQDGTLIQEYNLKEGDKLHLVVKKEASPAAAAIVSESTKTTTTTGCIETQTEIEPKVLLEREMTRILKVK